MEALAALEAWGPVEALRRSRFVYPAVSAAHVAGIALLFGAILPLDLRLLGAWRSAPLETLARVLVPVAAAGLALAATAGAALFAVSARDYVANPFFLAKLGLVAAGAANALALRRSAAWRGRRDGAPRLALAGLVSIAIWLGAILAGRMIAFA